MDSFTNPNSSRKQVTKVAGKVLLRVNRACRSYWIAGDRQESTNK